jgi:hypothetical protein
MNSHPPVPAEPTSLRTASWLFLAVALGLNLWLTTRHWTESLRDGHEFRQIQTAITADYLRQGGFKLAYETPVLGPPWSIPMEFPTYQWLVATVSNTTGLHLEQSGRLVSLLCFYAALPAIWLLLGRWGASALARRLAVVAVLTCPLLAFYSRTFLIESTALALSCWFLWTFTRATADDAARYLAAALVLGTLAALTKVTTFAVFCVPAGLIALAATFAWRSGRPGIRSWRAGIFAAAGLAVPVAAAIAWVAYTDRVKALNPYAGFLSSAALHEWNWGTLAQRFQPEFWSAIYRVISTAVLSEPALLLLLGALPALSRPTRGRVLLCVALFFSGCLLFSNLYFVHDYYSYATAAFLAVALGLAVAGLLEESRLAPAAVWTLLALVLASQVAVFWRGYGGFYQRANAPVPPFAEIIRRTTQPADILMAFGLDWNGMIPYYAQRRAIMVPHQHIDDRDAYKKSLAALGDRRIGAILIGGTLRTAPEFVVPRLRQFNMELFPIASTNDMDLYLRTDLHAQARLDLRGNQYPGVVFQLNEPAPKLDEVTSISLTGPDWRDKFTMCRPAPQAYRSPFHPAVDQLDGVTVIRTHAPMELIFHVPPGATRIKATGALVPDAYSGGNSTDGVILQLFEELPDGRRQLLAERELKPMTRPADRAEVTLAHTAPQSYRGVIVLRIDPGQMGNINCDWGYWRSVEIE